MNSSCNPLEASTSSATSTSAHFSSVLYEELNNIILNAFCLGALVPISISLVLTSSHLWKKPVFILNACAIVCAMVFGGITVKDAKDVVAGHPASMQRSQAIIILSFLIPICTQSILLVRILAVYPPRCLTWKKNFIVYGVLAVVLTARIINVGFFFNEILSELRRSMDVFVVWKSPYVRVDWFLQLFYVIYTSTLFLMKLGEGSRLTLSGRVATSVAYSNNQRNTYAQRLRTLFWIAAFNFVFPTLLDIVKIILVFRSTDSFALTDLIMTNIYVDIVCVLLATIWCAGRYWEVGNNADKIELKAGTAAVESLDSVTFATPSQSRLASHVLCSHSHTVDVLGREEK